jgi:hypothetical protein
MHKKPHFFIHRAAVLLVALAVATAAQTAFSQSPQSNGKKYVATKAIVKDQATGQVRMPTQSEVDAMVAQISSLTNSSTDGLQAKTLANGTKQLNLQGRFQEVVIARANTDGTMETRCVSSVEEAAAFLGLEEAQ